MKLRSLLFVPADSDRKFAKANTCGADALILDLEDSVAPGRKAFARDAVKNLLGASNYNWQFLVRINPLGTGLTLEDLAAVVRPGLDGILIPKVNGAQDVELISHYIDVLEVAAGMTPGHVKLLTVATETAAAMVGLASYTAPSKRHVAMTWGADQQGTRRFVDISVSGRPRPMSVRGGCGRRPGAGNVVRGLQGSPGARGELPYRAP